MLSNVHQTSKKVRSWQEQQKDAPTSNSPSSSGSALGEGKGSSSSSSTHIPFLLSEMCVKMVGKPARLNGPKHRWVPLHLNLIDLKLSFQLHGKSATPLSLTKDILHGSLT